MDGWRRLAEWLTWVKENYDIDTAGKGQGLNIDQEYETKNIFVYNKDTGEYDIKPNPNFKE